MRCTLQLQVYQCTFLMAGISAGILVYRTTGNEPECFLVHPGGPYYAKKDNGIWSVPKGELDAGESPEAGALREFKEETGFTIKAAFTPLPIVKKSSGTAVHVFAVRGNPDPERLQSNLFSLEWPPKSGIIQSFPEVDKGAWFTIATARQKILPYQLTLLDALEEMLRPEQKK